MRTISASSFTKSMGEHNAAGMEDQIAALGQQIGVAAQQRPSCGA
jgi:hypothetical protein